MRWRCSPQAACYINFCFVCCYAVIAIMIALHQQKYNDFSILIHNTYAPNDINLKQKSCKILFFFYKKKNFFFYLFGTSFSILLIFICEFFLFINDNFDFLVIVHSTISFISSNLKLKLKRRNKIIEEEENRSKGVRFS